MEFKKIKELNFTFDRDFNYELKSDNPNYIHYNGYLDLISVDVLLDILDKTFQGIKYEISLKSKYSSYNYNLNILGFDITIRISDKAIYFNDINSRNFLILSKNQKFSNVNILKGILDNLKISKNKNYFINLINSIPEFEYKFDYNENPNILEIYYRKLKINFIVEISSDKIEYISYLFHEGETYYCGDEKLTTNIIKSRIEYYKSLLRGESDIKEILKSFI
jgi:hypothetical protein